MTSLQTDVDFHFHCLHQTDPILGNTNKTMKPFDLTATRQNYRIVHENSWQLRLFKFRNPTVSIEFFCFICQFCALYWNTELTLKRIKIGFVHNTICAEKWTVIVIHCIALLSGHYNIYIKKTFETTVTIFFIWVSIANGGNELPHWFFKI